MIMSMMISLFYDLFLFLIKNIGNIFTGYGSKITNYLIAFIVNS